jgi:DNA-binding CsgD family transcriptional regulator
MEGFVMAIKAEWLDKDLLTGRESEVAALMSEGYSDKTIATLLAISIKTVSAHTQAIYCKLGLRSHQLNARCAAIVTMVARGMIRLSLNGIVAVLIFNTAQIDDGALRVRNGRNRTSSFSRFRKVGDV